MRGVQPPATLPARSLLTVVLAMVVVPGLTGCAGPPASGTVTGRRADSPASAPVSSAATSGASPVPSPPPHLGGPAPAPVSPPATPMTRLEKSVAHRIAERVAAQGLDVAYLDCPKWHGDLPRRLSCTGYLDGVTATVRVRLHRVTGSALSYDATLGEGVFATRTLVDQLGQQGFHHVDCGSRPAYPTRVGERIVCAVSSREQLGSVKYVVATVTDKHGAVRITEY
ncbi:MAG: hypothetical protein ACRDPB_00860 [Nocardioidaceae bacterium]